MIHLGLWHIREQGPSRLSHTDVKLEKHLESWIENDPELLQGGLTIVGRQIHLAGGTADLLALDTQGRWVVIEVKRGTIYRDAIAQILDYAASIRELAGAELRKKIVSYLSSRGGRLENVLGLQQESEIFSDEDREVKLIVVGSGRDPGIERVVKFLAERSNLDVSLVSFQVFALANGENILGRELTETEPLLRTDETSQQATAEEICLIADSQGIGKDFRSIKEAAEQLGLPVRPYKRSIMYTPPQNRNRMLFTAAAIRRPGGVRLYSYAKAFAENFPVSEEEALSALGPDGWREFDHTAVEAFITGLKHLLGNSGEASG